MIVLLTVAATLMTLVTMTAVAAVWHGESLSPYWARWAVALWLGSATAGLWFWTIHLNGGG